MPRAFDDPRYPQAVARFARAFAERYRTLVDWYTPLNEPHMTAWMCGHQGVWPPYSRGERGYLRVAIQAALGIVHTVEALREVNPRARIVQVEAAAVHRAAHPELTRYADEERIRRFLHYDLILGRVTPDHPLHTWLLRSGTRPGDLEEIREHAGRLDIMGMNFYPQWSTHELHVNRRGNVRFRNTEYDGRGFGELIRDYWQRYGLPIMITETSADGSDDTRDAWLTASVGAIKELRRTGVPVIGYTWFPLFTMIDWRYRHGRVSIEDARINLGLFRLREGTPRWAPTRTGEHFARLASMSEGSVGGLSAPVPGSYCSTG
jgi:beta-glucosidase/6-phospho-beta-glucosidase/beta-galactosidase